MRLGTALSGLFVLAATGGVACGSSYREEDDSRSRDAGIDASTSAFTLRAPPLLALTTGTTTPLEVEVVRGPGFTDPVAFTVGPLPAGVALGPDATLAFTVDAAAAHGSSRITITGTAGTATATVEVEVLVRGAAGALDTSFAERGVLLGDRSETCVRRGRVDGFIAGESLLVVTTDVWYRFTPEGTLDPAFGTNGKLNALLPSIAATHQSSGRIITVRQDADTALVSAHDRNGAVDTTFGSAGTAAVAFPFTRAVPTAIAVQPDDKILVLARVARSGRTDLGLARLLPDGSLDPSFGSGGHVAHSVGSRCTAQEAMCSDTPLALAVTDGGLIVVTGATDVDIPRARLFAAVFDASGGLTPFEGDGAYLKSALTTANLEKGVALAIDGGGFFVLGSDDTLSGSDPRALLLHYSASGLDTSFGSKPESAIRLPSLGASALARQPDGKLLIGAGRRLGSSDSWLVGRYDASGALDPGFERTSLELSRPVNPRDRPTSILLQPDGRIVAVGCADEQVAVVRYWN